MTRFEQPGMMPEPTDAEKVEQVRNLMRGQLPPEPAPVAPMADERDTAQWYVVNSQMPEIRQITGPLYGRGWTQLGDERREALRRELYRILAIGEALDRAAGRDSKTGDALPGMERPPTPTARKL